MTKFLGKEWIVTITKDLGLDDTVYYFTDPFKFFGVTDSSKQGDKLEQADDRPEP